MAKKMLIDATHNEEVRVAIVDGNRLEEFDSETSTKQQIKGNIYLAKVIRIEPSLQAAFVEFGGNRHGFLPFGEIHPDYFRIPVSDRAEEKVKPEKNVAFHETPLIDEIESPEGGEEANTLSPEIAEANLQSLAEAEDSESDLVDEDELPLRPRHHHKYKIQEVVKRRQIMLVQVVKEERGNKGAAMTTYLSLPGRYCVLMPNAGHRGGGISRKISDGTDRRRLRDVLKELDLPEGMSLIVRTAGQERNKLEIRRDFDYLLRLWEEIRETTLKSTAPEIIYAEGDLIKRSIRDVYDPKIDQILVEGEETYKKAKAFMKALIPSHTKKVQCYKDTIPLFHRFKVEEQIDIMMNPVAKLPSGGSIVINPTEALVAIDVNSGKSTRERHIDETALKTNLEAADEVGRQMRLRDLAGLVVIDFIDMSDPRHIQSVEKRLKEATRHDRARIQIGRISQFGLLELSRQRLRPSLIETNSTLCHHCRGTGLIRSIESMSLFVLRAIESEGIKGHSAEIAVTVPTGVDLYLLNQKRPSLTAIEARYQMKIIIGRDDTLDSPDFRLECLVERKEPFMMPPQMQHIPEPEQLEEEEKIQELEILPQTEETGSSPEEMRHVSSQGEGRHRRRRRQLYSNRRDRDRHRDGNNDNHQDEQPHAEGISQPQSIEVQISPELMVAEDTHTRDKETDEAAHDSPSEQAPSGEILKSAKRSHNRRRHQRQPQKDEGKEEKTPTETSSAKEEPSSLKVETQGNQKAKEISVPITALPQGLESAHKKNSRSRWWKRLIES